MKLKWYSSHGPSPWVAQRQTESQLDSIAKETQPWVQPTRSGSVGSAPSPARLGARRAQEEEAPPSADNTPEPTEVPGSDEPEETADTPTTPSPSATPVSGGVLDLSSALPSGISSQDGFQTVTVTQILNNTTVTGTPSAPTSDPSADADASSVSQAMALNGDAVVALIAGFSILLLLAIVVIIWLLFRDRTPDDAGTSPTPELPPTINLELPSARATPDMDIMGRPAATGPGMANWPLPSNQIRIPIRPRPKRRTLSSELSPFGYIHPPISETGEPGEAELSAESRPSSISAAWLRPPGRGSIRRGNGASPGSWLRSGASNV